VIDPQKSGTNVIVLKGGPNASAFSKTYQQSVEVPVNAGGCQTPSAERSSSLGDGWRVSAEGNRC